MIDKRIFEPDRLGSEKEETGLQYNGFAILVQVNAENSFQAIEWVKHAFSGNDTEFNEEGNRYFIGYNSDDQAVEVIPCKIKFKETDEKRARTYNLFIGSDFFGFKWYQEKKHQELCYTILSKIDAKRAAFLVKEGKRFPLT
jgi:hypothetical protein